MSSRSPIALSSALAVALALAAGPAAALGLGQIQVKSQPGQPLVAEIPIISSDPAELQGLQVQLASPETFSRVGLEPPQGVVSSLRFEPALDDRGHPVIRVTSPVPVQQPLLTFLLEVDWGEGRLVREYSALLDTPRTVSAPLQAPIQAPTVAPSNTIVRPVVAPVAAVVPQPTPAPVPVANPAPTAIPLPPSAAPTPPPVATAPEPMATPARSNEYGPVRPGQTLSQIAATLDDTRGYSIAQTMLALLRANPDAFIDGNINRLKRGEVLHLPQAEELAHYNHSQAAAVVREQMVQWRDARRPSLQPAAVAATLAPAPHNPASHNNTPRNNAAAVKPARTTDARLEILPPSGRDQRAGANQAMRSGIQAGGEGEMLRQQLQETKESLAARDAEVHELKTRVADLEKLQQQQQQLITLKDSALATAQQNLAASNRKAAVPAPVKAAVATTTGQTRQPSAPPQPMERSSGTIWLWGGLVLIFAALAGWLLTRRRSVSVTPKRGFDTAALAASIPVATREPERVDTDEVPIASFQAPEKTQPPASVQPPHWTSAPAAVGAVPTWHGGAESAPVVVADATGAGHQDAGRQLELAQAYLDLGDEDAARALLREVLDGHDPAARKTAALLLRDL
jgi:pilus assembly protein FimV